MTALQALRNLCREVRRLEKYFHGFPAELVKELDAAEKMIAEKDGKK